MTRRDWWQLSKFALLSGLCGPLLIVLLFWWFPLALESVIGGSLEDLSLITMWLPVHGVTALLYTGVPFAVFGRSDPGFSCD